MRQVSRVPSSRTVASPPVPYWLGRRGHPGAIRLLIGRRGVAGLWTVPRLTDQCRYTDENALSRLDGRVRTLALQQKLRAVPDENQSVQNVPVALLSAW